MAVNNYGYTVGQATPMVPNQQTMPMMNPVYQVAPTISMVPIPNRQEAINYPVAYGNTVILKDQSAPYIYIKSAGNTQFDTQSFDVYKKEDQEKPIDNTNDNKYDSIMADIESMRSQISELRDKISGMSYRPKNHQKNFNREDDGK